MKGSNSGMLRWTKVCGAIALGIVLFSPPARADRLPELTASAKRIRANVQDLRKRYLDAHGYRGRHYAEERLVDGVNHYDLKDYHRASIILLDIIENFSDHPAFPEALYYYADSLFLSRDFYGARTEFQRFLDMGESPGYTMYRSAAIARLVEVAVHLDDFTQVGQYIDFLASRSDARSQYIKGKYHYFQEDYEQARREFAAVRDDEELVLKAAYFIGATYVKELLIDDAMTAFQNAVQKFPEVRPSHQDLLDLLYLGLGRVQYEKDDVENAIVAYGRIDKYSPYFDVALYESAAANMRAGNTIGAERTLEVLTVAIPDSRYIPKAKLLRGQLLSSAGRYEEAETVFQQTIEEFSPIEEMMEKALSQSGDSGEFFDLLMARSVDTLDVQSMIPNEVVTWAGEEPEVKRAFLLTEDLAKAQTYTSESERLAELIGAVVNGTDPVNAIPALRMAMRQNQQYRNQLAKLAMQLMIALEAKVDAARMGGLASRRQLFVEPTMWLPVDDSSFKDRERAAKQKHTALRKELARHETMLDKLQAVITGLERYVDKPEYRNQVPKTVLAGYNSQLQRYRATVNRIRDAVAETKLDIEKAQYQIGIGGEQDLREAAMIKKLFALTRDYAEMAQYAGRKSKAYQVAIDALLKAANEIDRLSLDIETLAKREVDTVRMALVAEEAKLKQYQIQLNALNGEAKEVVNGIARENFSGIRERFEELMIKADVGIVDIAWMRKEEHKKRAVQLSRNRTNEIQWLDEEFEEADGFGNKLSGEAAEQKQTGE